MMKWIFSGLILLAVVFGLMNGRINEVSHAALTECGNAVQLTITLAGSMCLWSGMMKVAQKARLTEKLSAVFAPLISLLFPGLDSKSPAAQAITLNMSSNLLGLGNAATPLGIAAMRELQKLNSQKDTATNNMVMFVVLNTASLQIIPTTNALLRANAGSATPLDILPAVIGASTVSILSGIVMAKLLSGAWRTKPVPAGRKAKAARERV